MIDKFQQEVEKILELYKDSSLDVINNELQKLSDRYNNTGINDFDGLSPEQMRKLLYFKCNENMVKIKDEKGLDIPIIKQINYYLNVIKDNKEVKLTNAGYLPPKLVKEIYSNKYIEDDIIKLGYGKLTKETDSKTIELTKIICYVSGLVKKRNNKISLTNNGQNILETGNILSEILTAFISKFNWAYFDRFEDEKIGQIGAYYSIYLLNKYGKDKRDTEFYANKYFKAFFKEYVGINTDKHFWYKIRTFDRFLRYFGFLEENGNTGFGIKDVKKSSIFEKYIEIK
jgi:hypothetical protein